MARRKNDELAMQDTFSGTLILWLSLAYIVQCDCFAESLPAESVETLNGQGKKICLTYFAKILLFANISST